MFSRLRLEFRSFDKTVLLVITRREEMGRKKRCPRKTDRIDSDHMEEDL